MDRFWGLPAGGSVTVAEAGGGEWVSHEASGLGLPDEPVRLTLPGLRAFNGSSSSEAFAGGLAARRDDGGVELAFDPDAAVEQLLWRRGLTPGRPLASRMPFHYHRVPAPLRRLIRDAMARRGGGDGADAFPQWPADASVEAVRRAYLDARRAAEPDLPEPKPFWPGGKRFALALTHDVDSAEGLRISPEIAADERERGLRSCWYVVGRDFPLDPGALAALREAGGEIGLHDAYHDNKLAFLSPDEMARRLDSCRAAIEEHGMRGFRSPSMLRSAALYPVLAERFEYDSSIPDTGLLPQRNGCATVFPFERDGIPILPLTLPPDGQLLGRGLAPAEVVQAWIDKAEWVAALGGAAVHLTHPERGFSADPPMRAAYRDFLDWAAERARGDAWDALPHEIVEHWKGRESR